MIIQLEHLTKALLVVPLHEYKTPPEMDRTFVLFILNFPSAYSFLSLFRICSWQKSLWFSLNVWITAFLCVSCFT